MENMVLHPIWRAILETTAPAIAVPSYVAVPLPVSQLVYIYSTSRSDMNPFTVSRYMYM